METLLANSKQIKALIESHAERDDARFYSIAMQVAASAARKGHNKFAQELKHLIDSAKSKSKNIQIAPQFKPTPLAEPRGELSGILSVEYPELRLKDMELKSDIKIKIAKVLEEQKQQSKIRSFGLSPMRKLLLFGPPGVGKTMTAEVLSGELSLPLFSIQLDGLITKYLGETAAKLRLIFDAIGNTRGVYFFDEFDALGGERGRKNEVGEIRRVLNSFLQFLEKDDSHSLVIAATNHESLLDGALFRRFDCVIKYDNPDRAIIKNLINSRLAPFELEKIEWDKILKVASGLSHSEVTKACYQAAKNAILVDTQIITTLLLIDSLEDRRHSRPDS